MLQIRLLGRCSFETAATNGGLQPIASAKARQLLGYLACHPNRDLCRESVIGTLWGDTQEEQGRQSLRNTLWQIRSTLKPYQTSSSQPLIEAEGNWIRLNLHSNVSFDVIRLERLSKESRSLAQHRLPTPSSFEEVASLYSGPFLEGCYHRWCVEARESFQRMYLELLEQMMEREFTQGSTKGATHIAHKILEVDPTDEDAHWMIMTHYRRRGDRTGALRQYQTCLQIHREEYDALPSQRLVDLNDQIRGDLSEKHTVVPPVPVETDPRPDSLDILEQIRSEISDLREDIQAIKEQIDSHLPSSEKDPSSKSDFTSD